MTYYAVDRCTTNYFLECSLITDRLRRSVRYQEACIPTGCIGCIAHARKTTTTKSIIRLFGRVLGAIAYKRGTRLFFYMFFKRVFYTIAVRCVWVRLHPTFAYSTLHHRASQVVRIVRLPIYGNRIVRTRSRTYIGGKERWNGVNAKFKSRTEPSRTGTVNVLQILRFAAYCLRCDRRFSAKESLICRRRGTQSSVLFGGPEFIIELGRSYIDRHSCLEKYKKENK